MSAPAKPDQFDGMIGPGQILAWVASSCPWFDATPLPGRPSALMEGPEGFRVVLRAGHSLIGAKPSAEARDDYFALCLAAHHATVGSYVPTDVDSKIRGELWKRAAGETLQRKWRLATLARGWSPAGVSTRVETTAEGPVSGHDGEWLSVAVAAFGAALLAGDAPIADEAAAWIRGELSREERAYAAAEGRIASSAGALHLLRLAWILTHNAGDVDQGLAGWPADPRLAAARTELAELAHLAPERHGGVFHRAKAVYQTVAAEGHRNYPLRAAKALRRGPELLLPLGPCLEAWGRTVAASPLLNDADRAEILGALLDGIAKVRGQIGYHRALVGLATAKGGLMGLAKRLPAAAMRVLDDIPVRKQLTVTEEAFAAQLAKQVRTAAGR